MMTIEIDLKQALSRVLFLGGATDAGKTTVSRILAERHGWQLYNYDQQSPRHFEKVVEIDSRHRFWRDPSDEERWIDPEPEELVERTVLIFKDRFPLVVEDLLALSKDRIVLAEGFGLTPRLIAPHLSNAKQAAWLISNEAFKWQSMKQRGKYLRRLEWSNPERAIGNLFRRDMLLAQRAQAQAERRGLTVFEVDGVRTAEETADLLEEHFL